MQLEQKPTKKKGNNIKYIKQQENKILKQTNKQKKTPEKKQKSK